MSFIVRKIMRIHLVLLFMLVLDSTPNPLLDLTATIVRIYKDPSSGTSEQLMEAANEYVYQLVKLKMGAAIKKNGSLEELREVYLEGNPPFQVRNIPYDKMVEAYGWDSTHLSDYSEIMSDTRRIWQECLLELEKNKEPDEII